ncbi:MAG: T9SS type A sorting domain-containing protein [Flavobacteriaceae bacterium]
MHKNIISSVLLGIALLSSVCAVAQKHKNHPQQFGQSAFFEQLKERAEQNNGITSCGAYEFDQYLNSVNPQKETTEQFESWLAAKIRESKENNLQNRGGNPIITIPVVVHVIHDNKPYGVDENLTNEQILSQITVLNQDFRRLADTPGFNSNPIGADIEIEFCLAQRTPDGQATTGINRLNIPTPVLDTPWGTFVTWSTEDIEGTLKPTTVWDPEEYLNIWVVDNILLGMMAGYAQFPESSGLDGLDGGSLSEGGATDGVVIAHNCLGSSDIYPGGTYTAGYDKGRTTTHEVGHWLGLRHVWGDNASCEVNATDSLNDYCLDTPPANDANQGCAQTTTCTAPSMIENYMDYTDDSCKNTFTQDQKTRITTVMENSPRRISLITSSGCLAPQDFDLKIGAINLGGACEFETNPVVSLINTGITTAITSAEILYGIEGEDTQTYSWTGNLAPQASVEITLPLITFEQNSHFNVEITDVNGTIDDNLLNNSKSVFKTLSGVYAGSVVSLSITTDQYGEETTWELYNNTTATMVATGGDYSGEQTISQTFELQANDCYTFTIFDEYGDGMCCDYGPGSYSLTVGSEVIVSGGAFGASQSTSFIVDGTVGTAIPNQLDKITLYPNPANSIVNIVTADTTNLPESFSIYNALGQMVKAQNITGSSDLSVDISSLSKGVYIIKINNKTQSQSLRFIKQ